MPRIANPARRLVAFTVRVPPRTVKQVDRYALLNGISRTEAARRLLHSAIEREVPSGEPR
jgi:hypothetical protein